MPRLLREQRVLSSSGLTPSVISQSPLKGKIGLSLPLVLCRSGVCFSFSVLLYLKKIIIQLLDGSFLENHRPPLFDQVLRHRRSRGGPGDRPRGKRVSSSGINPFFKTTAFFTNKWD
ncbi:hypothetical protein CUU66_06105 [Peribacillus deserti]|uniref:Uncharacterized protein n=1 Tax=Peribacillus deserti TaxID=673318 RepID=A0A2N5M8P9_9BACI|nr:hypothetical protein CUU66_06105 [Peribacillus deserti]